MLREILKCPNCKERAFSVTRKAFLGPARSVACENCGLSIGVQYSHTYLALAFIILAGLVCLAIGIPFVACLLNSMLLAIFLQTAGFPWFKDNSLVVWSRANQGQSLAAAHLFGA
jgi:uncharacterized protein (DUF983 family)